ADVSKDVTVLFSDKKLVPGKSVTVRTQINPKKTGYFNENINLYVGSQKGPIALTISGTASFIPSENDIACPPFGSEPNPILKNQIVVSVIDSITRQAVKNAEVQIHNSNVSLVSTRTGANGKSVIELPPGRFFVSTEADNYNYKQDYYYVNRQRPEIIILLNKDNKDVASIDEVIEVKEVEEVEEVKEVKEVRSYSEDKLSAEIYASNNIVFLIDRSTSMRKFERLDLLKQAMINLLEPMRDIDRLAIITYASKTDILLESTPATDQQMIKDLINSLDAEGRTTGGKGIKKAYQVASKNFIEGGNNQIIIATDGAFNVNPDDKSFLKLANRYAKKGIILSVVGIKNPEYTIKGLKALAKHGKGSYIVLNSWEDDSSELLEEIKLRSKKQ
ncbi:MAG: VWA domain-containing protein, partial [Bacteroidia bacterium]|nr:VWA domain-containing protein [Bacteroidia bacterium]